MPNPSTVPMNMGPTDSPIEYFVPPDDYGYFALDTDRPSLWHIGPVWNDYWKIATGKGIKVAILDTGIVDHRDLPKPIVAKSYISGQSVADGHGHGTHCAGTAVGRNGIGYAPGADLMVYKVLSNQGSGGSGGIARAVRDAVSDGADIISMSLGGGGPDNETNNNISYAVSQGVIVCVAAGNSGYNGRNTVDWPGAHKDSLTTAAFQSNGQISSFSSGGPSVKWALPGSNIISCGLRNNYAGMSGTSMATPGGAGRMACWLEVLYREGYSRLKSMEAIMKVVVAASKDMGTPGFDHRFGHGEPMMDKFFEMFENGMIGI